MPSQYSLPLPTGGLIVGQLQSFVTVAVVLQPLISAVIVTVCPAGTPVTVFPETVPLSAAMIALFEATKATL